MSDKKETPTLGKKLASELAKIDLVKDKILYLDRAGSARADIARELGKRYQHVKNVLDRELEKSGQAQKADTI